MADVYKILLTEWNLEEAITGFEDEGIDDVSFDLLDEETIKKLFPKAGPRLKFKNHLKEYLQKKQDMILFDSETTSTASTDTVSGTSDEVIIEPDEELKIALQMFDNYTDSRQSSKDSANLDEPPFKKPKSTIVIANLEELLRKNPEAQKILINKNKMTNAQRQKVVNICINELIAQYGPELNQNILCNMAKQIVEIFPNETVYIYMISSEFGGPKGKLWNRYRNIKKILSSVQKCKSQNIDNKSKPLDKPIENDEKDDQLDLHLDFLKVATEPFPKILESWQESHKVRKRIYLNNEEKMLEDFPCLQLNEGITLLEMDFNSLYPEKIDIIYLKWKPVRTAILKEIEERKIKTLDSTDGVDENVLAIIGLPYLFQPITIKGSRKGNTWRPTRSEVMDSFFLILDDINQLPDRIEKRTAKLEGLKFEIEPFAVIVGDLTSPKFYIWVKGIQYKVESLVRTVELLFKAIYTLRREYPCECEHIWLTLAELLFDFKPLKKNLSSAALLSDLKYYLKN